MLLMNYSPSLSQIWELQRCHWVSALSTRRPRLKKKLTSILNVFEFDFFRWIEYIYEHLKYSEQHWSVAMTSFWSKFTFVDARTGDNKMIPSNEWIEMSASRSTWRFKFCPWPHINWHWPQKYDHGQSYWRDVTIF